MKIFFALILMTIFFEKGAWATEIYEEWMNARALGMGNAYSAVVDDRDALHYNPAALDKIHGFHLTLVDMNIGTDAQNAYQIFQETAGSNYAAVVQQYFGQNIWVGLNDQLALSTHDFAIAGFDSFNVNFLLNNPAYPNLNMHLIEDYGLVTGAATSLLPNDVLRVGVAVKRITRYGGNVPFGPSILSTLSNSQFTTLINNTGTGYGLDTGMLLEMGGPTKPTLSAVWQNIGQTTFLSTGTSAPPPIDNNPVLGFALNYAAGPFSMIPSIEYRHINLSQSEELGKLINAGAEFNFPGLSVRAGFNQGYYTLGFGLNFDYLRIDFATYGVELDTYPGQLEDRRYIVQLTVDLNFDINFGGGDGANGESASPNPHYLRR